MRAFETAVRTLVYGFVLLVWGIIGFLAWLPLLMRTIAVYCVALVQSAFLSNGNLIAAQAALELSIRFYSRGFRQISDGFHTSASQGTATITSVGPIGPVDWSKFIREMLWFVLFWSFPVVIVWKAIRP